MVNSAALLLREHGPAGTSVAKVLEHSHAPRGSVRFHFPGGRDQLLTEAIDLAGKRVNHILQQAAADHTPPIEVFTAICRYYQRQLETSDFTAGCPIGATAQDSYNDPILGKAVATVIDEWTTAFAGVFVAAGYKRADARDQAVLCISALEGAILLARITRTVRPIELTLANLRTVLCA